MRFPRLDARDPDHRAVTLPDDLGSDPTLVLVSFSPQGALDVETWLSLRSELADDGLWCYDLLVLPNPPDGVEVSLLDELYAGDDARFAGETVRSLVAHTDLAAFQRALVLDGIDRVYAFVLHERRVRWRAFGPLTTPLEQRLRAALESGFTNDFDEESVDSIVS